MGNSNLNPSKSGMEFLTSTRFKNTQYWLDKTNWDRRILEDKVEKKEVAPFEKPVILNAEDEKLFEEHPDEAKEELGNLEKCPLCLLYFKHGLNVCTNCGMKVCSHCYFRVTRPPFRAPIRMLNERKDEVVKEGDIVDDSECVICEKNPWKVTYGTLSQPPPSSVDPEEVERRKKIFMVQQEKSILHFRSILEKNKKKKRKKKKKPKIKYNEEERELEEEEERISKQLGKMIPSELEIENFVELEAKMIEEALERELEETGDVPDIDSKKYNTMKKSVNMAMYGTIKKLKVEELRMVFEKKVEKNTKNTTNFKIDEEKEEQKNSVSEKDIFDEDYFDFLL